jgi:hypothetical protein
LARRLDVQSRLGILSSAKDVEYPSAMPKWEYFIASSWWVEAGRSDDYAARIEYRHVWQPDENIHDYPSGMSDVLGAEGWELVAITTHPISLLTVSSPQGNNGYGSFPTHKLFFKRPVLEQ